jgi:hypothetical protein
MRRVIFTYCVLTVCFYRFGLGLLLFLATRCLDGGFVILDVKFLGMKLTTHMDH